MIFIIRDLPYIDIPEGQVTAMGLELNGACGEDRPAAIPVIFQRDMVHHQFPVQPNRDNAVDHDDVERVPFANGIICHLQWCTTVSFVVV